MFLKTLIGMTIIILRIVIVLKIISWVTMKIFTNYPHHLSEIDLYLVLVLLDIWALVQQPTEISVTKMDV